MKKNILHYLRLIRFNNLLIVALTQYLIRYAIIKPILGINDFELQMGDFHFFLLVLSTIFITAAGYVINDYFDTRTDMLNRPEKVIIGRLISRRTAIILHWILNFAGIITGFYLALYIGVPLLGITFILVGGLLWFYSTNYNRQFLIGNVIIAFLTAMVPVMVILFEIPLLNREYGDILRIHQSNFNYIFFWVGSFGYFAFFTTLIRELIKDLQDREGDLAQGRRSVPIVLGVFYTKLIVGGLLGVILLSIAYLYSNYLMTGFYGERDYLSLLYFLFFLLIPISILLYKVVTARSSEEYKSANNLTKYIMLLGLMYALVVRYIITASL